MAREAVAAVDAKTQQKWVYRFEEGDASMRDLLGGKGANCAEMMRAGLPVPPGFVVTTEACNAYYDSAERFPNGMWEQALDALGDLETKTGKRLGDTDNPLLVSVRSGAKFSMPGMMDTILNLGLNDDTIQGLIAQTQNERFAWDSYRRFVQMYGNVVLEVDKDRFEHTLEEIKAEAGIEEDVELTVAHLQDAVRRFKAIVESDTDRDFPTAPLDQLHGAIEAVFASWNNRRAMDYRNYHKIAHDLGTAVNVQAMVFGNMGSDSGTGVAFTRNPSTGEPALFGEFLEDAQGEDVVAGVRTPLPIAKLREVWPDIYDEFAEIAQRLESHYREMQDMEFTVERGTLYMLQTRTGKRTASAAVRIAVDMFNEGLISKEEAISRVEPEQIDQLLHPRIDLEAEVTVIAKGLNASPGAAVGMVYFDPDEAESVARQGNNVILVRPETSPDDVHGMIASQGILTARGGATSHAAVVARGLGKPCVSGCDEIRIDMENGTFAAGDVTVKKQDYISLNGSTGEVILGQVPLIQPEITAEMSELLRWADAIRRLEVWANADYPRDAALARTYGAQGIGLCRTEHMFFEEERLPVVQQMILASSSSERQAALDKLLPIQRGDFEGILRAMDGLPVVIRLLDPPLHEFLPDYAELLEEVATLRATGSDPDHLAKQQALLETVASLREANPMLGLRGCRLGLEYPEIYEMQVRAILEAALSIKKEGGDPHPEIMIPLVSHANELGLLRKDLERIAKQVEAEQGDSVAYKFGTMIEVPRAALTADEIAEHAEFFSFGTNDLTQTTYGYSRDDAEGKFLLNYVENAVLPENPFQVLDRDGVGRLVSIAVAEGKKNRPDLEVGICGEHGGDPSSIYFCHGVGLDYVSCSPYRVPVARIAAAQVTLESRATADK
jgi:pyruvate,orthophosphate dikinase